MQTAQDTVFSIIAPVARELACLYPGRWLLPSATCEAAYSHSEWLFKVNYFFTHYILLVLVIWMIPPLSRCLRAALNFPANTGAWAELFGAVLFFLLVSYASAVGQGNAIVLAFTVVGRLGLLLTCLKVAADVIKTRSDERKKDAASQWRPKASPLLIIAMGAFDGIFAVITAVFLVGRYDDGSWAIAAGGLFEIVAGGLLLFFPWWADDLQNLLDPNNFKTRLLTKLNASTTGGSWITIFCALLLAFGSYCLMVGMLGQEDFIPCTIVARGVAFAVCIWTCLASKWTQKPWPWLVFIFGMGELAIAVLTLVCVL